MIWGIRIWLTILSVGHWSKHWKCTNKVKIRKNTAKTFKEMQYNRS